MKEGKIGKDGRIRLYQDEIMIIRTALRRMLDSTKHGMKTEMLIMNTYKKLEYDEKVKDNKPNTGTNKGKS